LERTQAMGAVRQQVWSEAQEEVASLRTQLNTQVAAASEAEERHRQALEVNELRAGRTSLPHVVDRFPHITCRRSQITDHRSQITDHRSRITRRAFACNVLITVLLWCGRWRRPAGCTL
jgi:hypothetical protein